MQKRETKRSLKDKRKEEEFESFMDYYQGVMEYNINMFS